MCGSKVITNSNYCSYCGLKLNHRDDNSSDIRNFNDKDKDLERTLSWYPENENESNSEKKSERVLSWYPEDEDESNSEQRSVRILSWYPEDEKQTVIQDTSEEVNKYKVIVNVVFWTGISSIFLYWIGMIPILGSLLGLFTLSIFSELDVKQKRKVLIGLGLNVVYIIVYLYSYGHIG
jgi:hypothetical protein